jgi:acyl-CoA reductase-like NAD-dependent aldehyde dehydrogenase
MATRRQHTNELDAEDRNAMPDSAFAFPRLRKEPLNDASHVRNAIARFDQVRDATDAERAEAFRRIKRAAKRHGVDMTEARWQDLGKPSGSAKDGGKSRDELYAEAKRRNVKGRSSMNKDQLQRALSNG